MSHMIQEKVTTNQINRVIEHCSLFRSVDKETITKLLERESAPVEQCAKGSTIYDESHYRKALGIILQGSAMVTKGDAEHRITMSRLKEGDLFGMAALFYEEEGFISKVVAEHDTTVLFLEKTWLTDSFAYEPAIAANYITILSERIHFLSRKITTFTGSNGTDCLRRFLRSEYQRTNAKELSLTVSMTTLATQLNVSRASLYRSFQILTDQGILERKGKTIQLLQPQCL